MRSYKYLAAVAALVLSSAAMAADIPAVSGPVSAPAFAAPAAPASKSSSFSWSGFYVGANAGFVVEDSATRVVGPDFNYAFEQAGFRAKDDAGFTGGGQVGYAIEMGEVVLGVEADINYLGSKRSFVNGNDSAKLEGDYFGTVRPTVGFVVGEGLLAYATGGFAYGKTSADVSPGTFTTENAMSDSIVRTGWALGGGMKYAVTENIIAGGEYLYVNLGRENYFEDSAEAVRVRDESINHVLRAKVDWKFN